MRSFFIGQIINAILNFSIFSLEFLICHLNLCNLPSFNFFGDFVTSTKKEKIIQCENVMSLNKIVYETRQRICIFFLFISFSQLNFLNQFSSLSSVVLAQNIFCFSNTQSLTLIWSLIRIKSKTKRNSRHIVTKSKSYWINIVTNWCITCL